MDILISRLEEVDASVWNQRVKSLPEGTISQSTHIGDFFLVTGGWYRPVYLLAEDEGGMPLGQLLVLEGFSSGREELDRPVFHHVLSRLFRTYIWMEGPLVFDREHFAQINSALVNYADNMARSRGFMIRRAHLPYYQDEDRMELASRAFAECGFDGAEAATFLVDVQKEPEAQWAGLKSSARKNLKKMLADENLCVGEISGEEKARTYWRMLVDTQLRNSWPVTYKTFGQFREYFWERPHRLGILHGAMVENGEGVPLAGLLFRAYNGWIQELGVAYSDFALEKRIYGQDLLKWHIMQWGRDHGCSVYNLMGVEPDSQDSKKQGIFQFKAKWGGALYKHRVFSKTYSSWKTSLVRRAVQLS